MAEHYPVRTLIDMARIPREAWQRFAVELPALLAVVAPLVAYYDGARAQGADVPEQAYTDLLDRCDWIDDEAGTVDVTVDARGPDGETVAYSEHHFTIPRGA